MSANALCSDPRSIQLSTYANAKYEAAKFASKIWIFQADKISRSKGRHSMCYLTRANNFVPVALDCNLRLWRSSEQAGSRDRSLGQPKRIVTGVHEQQVRSSVATMVHLAAASRGF